MSSEEISVEVVFAWCPGIVTLGDVEIHELSGITGCSRSPVLKYGRPTALSALARCEDPTQNRRNVCPLLGSARILLSICT